MFETINLYIRQKAESRGDFLQKQASDSADGLNQGNTLSAKKEGCGCTADEFSGGHGEP